MSALNVRLNVVATDAMDLFQQPIALRHQTARSDAATVRWPISRALASESAHLRCPHCDSIIYSRRHKLCGVCGRDLPEQILFSPAEAARLENILRTERERHKRWMKRDLLDALSR